MIDIGYDDARDVLLEIAALKLDLPIFVVEDHEKAHREALEAYYEAQREAASVVYQGLDLARKEEVNDSGFIMVEQMRGARGWLARVLGRGGQYGVRRDFIDADEYDLSRSGRGHKYWHTKDLRDGVYEANSTWRSMTPHRVFFKIEDHKIHVIDSKREALNLAEKM